MEDYSKLKGMEVTCINSDSTWSSTGTVQAKGFVADIDFNKGITIKSKKNQEDLVCLNRKQYDDGWYGWMGVAWGQLFESIVKQIKQGRYKFSNITKERSDTCNSSPCAFE